MPEKERVNENPIIPGEGVPAILVVDDEVLIRLALADFLRDCGYEVIEAGSAVDAIEFLQANPSRADLVLSDIRMPGAINGFGLAKWIRETLPSIPVILASGEATKFDAAREMCANVPFFQKPYDPQALVARIREMLAMHRV